MDKESANRTEDEPKKDKTLISAWGFLPEHVVEVLEKNGIVHLNDFIRLNRPSVCALPLSDDDKGLVLCNHDALLEKSDPTFVPFPFVLNDRVKSYSTLFSVMRISVALLIKAEAREANLVERIVLATCKVLYSMFDSSSFFAEKRVFATTARPSVIMAEEGGMIRLWDEAAKDLRAFSKCLADEENQKLLSMADTLYDNYRMSLESLHAPMVENWYNSVRHPFMHNLCALARNPDDEELLKKAERDVSTHITDLKCYQFALRIRELDIYSKAPLPLLSGKPIYDEAQLAFVAALKKYDEDHPKSVRTLGVVVEDLKDCRDDSPLAFTNRMGGDFSEFVLRALELPMFVVFKNPMPGLLDYDGNDAEQVSPWHDPMRDAFLQNLTAYFHGRAKKGKPGGEVRRLWLNAEAEVIAYKSDYVQRTSYDAPFDAPQRVVDAANAAAREEWIEKRDEWMDREDIPFVTEEQLKHSSFDKSSVIYSRSTPARGDFLTPKQVAGFCAELWKQEHQDEGYSSFSLIASAMEKVEQPTPDEEAVREVASSDLPEIVCNAIGEKFEELKGQILDRFDKIDRNRLKPILQNTKDIKNKVDPFDRYRGIDGLEEKHRPLVRAAIDYCYTKQIELTPIGGKATEGHPRLAEFAETVWALPEYRNLQAGFKNFEGFKTVLNEQAHRNERSFLWVEKK